jgi:DNA-binding transcriptional MerR regulator
VAETGSSVDSFSGKQAAEIVEISYRQLDYWARTDLIRPSVSDAHGSGSRRRYSYRDLIELKLVKSLLDAGVKLETIREAFSYVRDQLGEDLSSAKLVLAGKSAVLVHEDELIDVFARYKGQGVLNLLDLDDVREEVDAAVVDLFPGGGGGTTAEEAATESTDAPVNQPAPAARRPRPRRVASGR